MANANAVEGSTVARLRCGCSGAANGTRIPAFVTNLLLCHASIAPVLTPRILLR